MSDKGMNYLNGLLDLGFALETQQGAYRTEAKPMSGPIGQPSGRTALDSSWRRELEVSEKAADIAQELTIHQLQVAMEAMGHQELVERIDEILLEMAEEKLRPKDTDWD